MTSLFFTNIRFQIVALCYLIIIISYYIGMKKLKLYSTRWFNAMMIVSVINLIFDVITVYTVTHLDMVSAQVNDICHRIFVLTLILFMVSLYFYIEAIGRGQKRFTLVEMLIRLLPAFLALGLIAFGEINYYFGEDGAYSYGATTIVTYSVLAVYAGGAFFRTFQFKGTIRKERLMSMRIGILIWIAAGIIQIYEPKLLLSGLAVALLVFFFYFTFQNPQELQDNKTGALNERALNLFLMERHAKGKPFHVVGILMKDVTELMNLLGSNLANDMLTEVVTELGQLCKTQVYHYDQMLYMIFKKSSRMNCLMPGIQSILEKERMINRTKVSLTTSIYLLECPKYAADVATFAEVDHYLMKTYLPATHDKQVIEVDEEVIRKQRRAVSISNLIMDALANDGLEVFYQPIYDAKNKKFTSAEALVRLKNTGDFGFVSPEEFIPMAERNGMISELGEIVFEKVCRFGREKQLPDLGVHYIEVNLSGVQIVDENICQQLDSIMNKYGTDPSFINLEITETAAVEYMEILKKNMKRLREMGCSFSMDDFGTGYSNISQIAQVKYDLIKLDKSLLWPCYGEGDTKKAKMILESIVGLVHKMGIKIVQEGIETEEQKNYLESLGVEYMQGYYFSRPVKEEDYFNFVTSKNV